MDAERFKRIEELFRRAADLDPPERREWLDGECGNDRELREEVEALLAADGDSGKALGDAIQAAAHEMVTLEATSPALERVGPYRLQRELGRGGMGTVFLGLRDDEAFTKQVAVKLLTHSRFRTDLLERFRTERQILATLEHPNIARLLDGGTAEGGEPYVVMEYVDGRSLLRYCDEEGLSVRDRLALFSKICNAVQYAHDHSIVHRDLKPGNVLVGADREPKLLDFGIAKLLDPGEVATVETATSMRLMTPQYASPEQVRGQPVTPATDVYALGVILYELLSGQRPYSVDSSDLTAVERAVCEQEPVRPSRALADSEGSALSQLRRAISGDLDNIVLTAMRKEPQRRYASAADLAADLHRYLGGHPVQARRASMGYRLGKFVRRKPALAALFLTLLIAVPAVGILGNGAVRQRQAARETKIVSLLREARWLQERRRNAEAAVKAEQILNLEPEHPLALRYRALAWLHLGLPRDEGPDRDRFIRGAQDDAVSLIRILPDVAWPNWLQAYIFERLGAEDERVRAVAAAESHEAEQLTEDDLAFRAELALARKDFEAAKRLLTDLIARRPDGATAIASRAFVYEMLEEPEKAFLEYRVAVGIDPSQDFSLVDLARLSIRRGEYDEAQEYLRRSFDVAPNGAYAYEARGYLLLQQGLDHVGSGNDEEALRMFRESEKASKRGLEIDDSLQWAELNLATCLISRYRLRPESDPSLLTGVVESYENVLSRWSSLPETVEEREIFFAALANSCDALIQLKSLDRALETCARATRMFPEEAVGFYNLAGVYALLGQDDEALIALRQDADLGDTDWEYLSRDAWFESLRDRPEFEEILERMRGAARVQR